MNETLKIANSSTMWILSILSVSIVLIQVLIFFRLAKQFSKDTNLLSENEIKKALKIGVIGTLGPAMAVFAIAVALLAQIGGPITLSRVGVIGSAAFEMIAAKLGSGGTIATSEFTPDKLSAASWVMALGGSGWLIMVLLTTKKLDTLNKSLEKANPLIVAYAASFTPFVIFFTLGYKEVYKGLSNSNIGSLSALIAGAFVMYIIKIMSKNRDSLKWLKEWAMGFAVIAGMIAGSFMG